MPQSSRSLRSPLLGASVLLLLFALPLAAQEKTADELEWEAHLARLSAEMAARFQKVVMPKLVAAGSNDQVFDEAEQAYTDWIRELTLKGIELDAPSARFGESAGTVQRG